MRRAPGSGWRGPSDSPRSRPAAPPESTIARTRPAGAARTASRVGLSIPIFNGFIWEYNQQQAEHNAEAALARAQGLTQQVIFQVFQSYYSLQTQAARVGTADELLASATESAEAARGRYQAGVGSLLELLSAENSLAAARAQRIQARLGWQAALRPTRQGRRAARRAGSEVPSAWLPRGPKPIRCHEPSGPYGPCSRHFAPRARGVREERRGALRRCSCHRELVADTVAIPYVLAASGTVEPLERVNVEAQVAGQLLRIRFREGDQVTKGQVLFEIDSRPFRASLDQAEAMLARDRAQAENAERDLGALRGAGQAGIRHRPAVRRRPAPPPPRSRRRCTADSAAVETARLNLQYATVRAPIVGLGQAAS